MRKNIEGEEWQRGPHCHTCCCFGPPQVAEAPQQDTQAAEQGEPVAWACYELDIAFPKALLTFDEPPQQQGWRIVPLYARPQPPLPQAEKE